VFWILIVVLMVSLKCHIYSSTEYVFTSIMASIISWLSPVMLNSAFL